MRILFIGNSHTYAHALPYQCRELLKALGTDAEVSMVAQPDRPLLWHAENPASRQALRYADWDHVILQQAAHPPLGKAAMLDGLRALRRMLPDGQSLWLYKTWSEKSKPEEQAAVEALFAELSRSEGVPVIPIADAWYAVLARWPEQELYESDGSHAGRSGSYLAALCMVRTLTGASVRGLPSTLRHDARIINRVSPEAAELYQDVVDKVVEL